MKIAIQGHSTRGKEVIQILESLGGINKCNHLGNNIFSYYEIHGNSIQCMCIKSHNYKYYTLEEFEQEFPFKIGDKVIHSYNPNFVGIVVDIKFDDYIPYRVNIEDKICTCGTTSLKLHKEMKEERNITLTLEKAKEWYKKGGELKEVALQAYSEKELNKIELPKTWEEFCDSYPVKETEAVICCDSTITDCSGLGKNRDSEIYKDVCPSKESAEAHLALIQLEQLRDCYRQGDIPNFTDSNIKYCIIKSKNNIILTDSYYANSFLSFTKKDVAEKFLNNFKPLIKIAEDYI